MLINLKTSFDPATTETAVQTLILAISVGFGSTMQALLGRYLILSKVKLHQGLLHGREVVYFLVLGGPISCLVSASWGVTTLWFFDFVSNSDFAFSWVTWWLGDAIGVLLMLPLIFVFCGRPRELWLQRRIRVALPMIFMLVATLIVFVIASNQVQGRIESEFRAKALVLSDSLEKTIIRNTEVLYSVHGLFSMSGAVSFDEFESYSSRALDRNPGIKALSWSAVIGEQQRLDLVESIQAQGFPEFEITELNASGQLVRAGSRERYAVVSYVVPITLNRKVMGFDSYSDATRKYALDLASSAGELVATAAIELVQDSGKKTGVLLILPVYKLGIMPQSKEEKTDQLSGYVAGLLRTDEILREALNGAENADLSVNLVDDSEPSEPVLLANNLVVASLKSPLYKPDFDTGFLERLSWQKSFVVGQRTWRLKVGATDEYFVNNRSRTPWGILVGGLLFTASFGMFLLILTGRGILDQKRARDLATEVSKREQSEKTLFDANEKLEILAKTDSLTQINNRLFIQELGKKLDAETKRYQIQYTALLLDIDHFKLVNDRWGHQTGDVALKEITRLVSAELRDSDYFGRWGGEEFIVIARNTSLEESIAFAERLCEIIGEQDIEPVGRVTISIGVTSNKGNSMFDSVIQLADKALYQAKENGRNRVESIA